MIKNIESLQKILEERWCVRSIEECEKIWLKYSELYLNTECGYIRSDRECFEESLNMEVLLALAENLDFLSEYAKDKISLLKQFANVYEDAAKDEKTNKEKIIRYKEISILYSAFIKDIIALDAYHYIQ